jgi:hypothetical protein
MKFSVERLLAFRTTSNMEDRSFLSGYFPLSRLPSLRLRSPVYSPESLGRDPNPGTSHWVSGTWGSLRVGATTPLGWANFCGCLILFTHPVSPWVLITIANRTTPPYLVGSPICHPGDAPDIGFRIPHWPRCKWEDNIKMDFRERGIDGANWIWLAQDRIQWQAL